MNWQQEKATNLTLILAEAFTNFKPSVKKKQASNFLLVLQNLHD